MTASLMTERAGTSAVKFIVTDFLGDFVYFPIWWETHGVVRIVRWALLNLRGSAARLGLAVWLKNLFVPMYGQYDMGGRLVSFFMRFFQIIFRFSLLLILFVIFFLLILLWIVAPIAVVIMIFYAIRVSLR